MIGIIGFNDLHLLQFLYKYTNVLDNHGITDYEVIFWNRSEVDYQKNFRGQAIAYNVPLNTYLPFHRKIRAFMGYKRFLSKTIKSRKYDKLIILTTQSAIPLYSLLKKKYKNRFIFDYRDITKENKSSIYRKMVLKLIAVSNCTMMSSLGFLKDLGIPCDDHIILAHNTQERSSHTTFSPAISSDTPIHISFWGMVRQPEFNCKFCDAFGNDPRFSLTYYGEGFYKQIQHYCEEKGYTNIFFTGRYTMNQIPSFAENTDIIHCVYEYKNDSRMKTALQVKMYDAIKYRKPLLIYKDSYVSDYIKNDQLALSLDFDEKTNIADIVYSWYCGLRADVLDKNYGVLERKIYQDDVVFESKLLEFVKD